MILEAIVSISFVAIEVINHETDVPEPLQSGTGRTFHFLQAAGC
jgi:hypothetical protein